MAFKVDLGKDEKACKQKYLMIIKPSQLTQTEAQTPWFPKAWEISLLQIQPGGHWIWPVQIIVNHQNNAQVSVKKGVGGSTVPIT